MSYLLEAFENQQGSTSNTTTKKDEQPQDKQEEVSEVSAATNPPNMFDTLKMYAEKFQNAQKVQPQSLWASGNHAEKAQKMKMKRQDKSQGEKRKRKRPQDEPIMYDENQRQNQSHMEVTPTQHIIQPFNHLDRILSPPPQQTQVAQSSQFMQQLQAMNVQGPGASAPSINQSYLPHAQLNQRIMPNDIILNQSIPRAIEKHNLCNNQPIYDHGIDGSIDPRPTHEYFDTLKDLEVRMRAYTKEAGFGLVLVQKQGTDKNTQRMAKCTKGVVFKKKKDGNEERKEEILDEDIQIVDDGANQGLCPFFVELQKLETTQKWYVKWVNSYHNHHFRKPLRTQGFDSYSNKTYDYSVDFGKTKNVQCSSLSDELQKRIEYLWFNQGLKKREIYNILSREKELDPDDIKSFLACFRSPMFKDVCIFQSLFIELTNRSWNYPKIKESNRYFKYDAFNCVISFSFSTNQLRNRYSDLILVDTTSCNKYCKDEMSVIFISGLDIYGEITIQFVSIIQKRGKPMIEVVLDNYLDAGFQRPQHVILDSIEFQPTFVEKLGIDESQIQLSFNEILKRMKKGMIKREFRFKEKKEILEHFSRIQEIESKDEFMKEFNIFYIKYKDRSEVFKQKTMTIYKLKEKFARAFTKTKFNFGFNNHKGNCNDRQVIMALRQLTRNSKFQDFFFHIYKNRDLKKQKLIIERLRRDFNFADIQIPEEPKPIIVEDVPKKENLSGIRVEMQPVDTDKKPVLLTQKGQQGMLQFLQPQNQESMSFNQPEEIKEVTKEEVKQSDQKIDFHKLHQKKMEEIDFIFGHAKNHFCEQYRISDQQHSRVPKEKTKQLDQNIGKDGFGYYIMLTFQNELNDRDFHVKLAEKSQSLKKKRKRTDDNTRYKLECLGHNVNQEQNQELFDCQNLQSQKGVPCSHIMTAYRYIFQKSSLSTSGKKLDYPDTSTFEPYFSSTLRPNKLFQSPITEQDEKQNDIDSDHWDIFNPSNLISLIKKRWICKYRLHNQYYIAKQEKTERLKWFFKWIQINHDDKLHKELSSWRQEGLNSSMIRSSLPKNKAKRQKINKE